MYVLRKRTLWGTKNSQETDKMSFRWLFQLIKTSPELGTAYNNAISTVLNQETSLFSKLNDKVGEYGNKWSSMLTWKQNINDWDELTNRNLKRPYFKLFLWRKQFTGYRFSIGESI